MRKLISFIVLFFFIGLHIHILQARTYVIVVGVSNYNANPSAPNLAQTTKDAKAFKQLFSKKTQDISILTSRYANHDNILAKLNTIASAAKEDDRIIFFYSGHGTDDAIYVYDGMLNYSDIVKVLNSSRSKQIICYIDACLSGSVGRTVAPGNSMKYSDMAFLVSSRSDESSLEHPVVGAGFFTQALIEGMRGKGDSDRNQKVTLEELFKFVAVDVAKRSSGRQHPQLYATPTFRNLIVY